MCVCVSSACLCPSTICLPARSRAAACCSSLSVDVHHHHCRPQWTRGRHASSQPLPLACLLVRACTAACPSASLPCPAWLCWIAPAAPENPLSHHRIPTGTPAPSQPVSQSSVSCTKTVSCSLDQAATSATTSPESSARAGPDISYLLSPRLLLARSPPPVISSNLAASATVSAPSPCDAAANNNNATASDQPFACGRPIHLATSSPNKRADYCSSLA